MARYTLAPKSRHQPQYEATHEGNLNRQGTEFVVGGRDLGDGEPVAVEKVGEEVDQSQQRPRQDRADAADNDRQTRQNQQPAGCGEVAFAPSMLH